MTDEIWTTRGGKRIQVGEMTEGHAKNALRMILRKHREALEQAIIAAAMEDEMSVGDIQEYLNAEHRVALSNPNCFFPLLDGGVYGSPDLARKYGRSI